MNTKMAGQLEAFLAEHPDFEDFQVSHQGGWPCAEAHLVATPMELASDSLSEGLFEATESPTTGPAPEIRLSPTGCKIFTYWEYEVGSKLTVNYMVECDSVILTILLCLLLLSYGVGSKLTITVN